MNETTKTNRIRNASFFKQYMRGKVLDIGCGTDRVVLHAEPYDVMYGHGNANYILKSKAPESYDCVYSSHCLEHMENVPVALEQWWSLVKPGGHLIIVVPDEDLYEQGFWPSRFNSEHKATFRLHQGPSWSPVSYNIRDVVGCLDNAEVLSADIQDKEYNYFFKSHQGFSRRPVLIAKLGSLIKRGANRVGLKNNLLTMFGDWCIGDPIDQTMGRALAQIQVVIRKKII